MFQFNSISIQELLDCGVAYVMGSRDVRGGAVIFIDASATVWDEVDVKPEDLAQLLVYYYRIPRYVRVFLLLQNSQVCSCVFLAPLGAL